MYTHAMNSEELSHYNEFRLIKFRPRERIPHHKVSVKRHVDGQNHTHAYIYMYIWIINRHQSNSSKEATPQVIQSGSRTPSLDVLTSTEPQQFARVDAQEIAPF